MLTPGDLAQALDDLRGQLFGARAVLEALAREHAPDEVAGGDGGQGGGDVDADGGGARGAQAEQGRAASAGGGARADLLDEPLVLQLLDDGRDGRALQLGRARDVGARDGLAVAYVVEDELPVDVAY